VQATALQLPLCVFQPHRLQAVLGRVPRVQLQLLNQFWPELYVHRPHDIAAIGV